MLQFPRRILLGFLGAYNNYLMDLFHNLHKGYLPMYNLNFGTNILLPKCKEAIIIHQYRPTPSILFVLSPLTFLLRLTVLIKI
jgi:hypothetical protein